MKLMAFLPPGTAGSPWSKRPGRASGWTHCCWLPVPRPALAMPGWWGPQSHRSALLPWQRWQRACCWGMALAPP